MKKYKLSFLVFSIIALSIFIDANAQSQFVIIPENSTLKIKGTSTVHDWEMEATDFTCKVTAKTGSDGLESISLIDFACPVDKITSDSRIMNNKTYDALEEKHHPEITFTTSRINEIKLSEKKANITGMLSIAGETREISFTSDLNYKARDRFTASGNVTLKMTNYNIDPPTAFLGALKTGDEVVVEYIFEFSKNTDEITIN